MSDTRNKDRFSWSRVKPTERALPETTEDVILLLESRIDVHQEWLDWFRSGDAAEVQEAMKAGVGTIESQEYYIAQYRAAIAIIRGENADVMASLPIASAETPTKH